MSSLCSSLQCRQRIFLGLGTGAVIQSLVGAVEQQSIYLKPQFKGPRKVLFFITNCCLFLLRGTKKVTPHAGAPERCHILLQIVVKLLFGVGGPIQGPEESVDFYYKLLFISSSAFQGILCHTLQAYLSFLGCI